MQLSMGIFLRSQNLRPVLISKFQILPSRQDEDFSFFFCFPAIIIFMKIPEHELFRTQLTDPRRRPVQGALRTPTRKIRNIEKSQSTDLSHPSYRLRIPTAIKGRNCKFECKLAFFSEI